MTRQNFMTTDLAALHGGSVDAMQNMASTLLEAGYKITLLNLEMARSAINQGAAGVRIGEPGQTAASFQPLAREMSGYFKNLAHISAETQVELARQVQSHLSEMSKNAVALIDRVSRTDANVGTAMAAAAMKSALSTVTASCQGLTDTARRVGELTQAGATSLADSVQNSVQNMAPAAGSRREKKAA